MTTPNTPLRLAGVDIAWVAGNASALAIGSLQGRQLILEQWCCEPFTVAAMAEQLLAAQVVGVSIDGPTIVTNQYGMRDCEKQISRRYSARGGGCYPANLTLFPAGQAQQLSIQLAASGYQHLQGPLWQIECYPHAALLEWLQLPYRHDYKKGPVAQRRRGQQQLLRLLDQLLAGLELALCWRGQAADCAAQVLDSERIGGLHGAALKENEDRLDALLCLLIAVAHARQRSTCYGDPQQGFIVVPQTLNATATVPLLSAEMRVLLAAQKQPLE